MRLVVRRILPSVTMILLILIILTYIGTPQVDVAAADPFPIPVLQVESIPLQKLAPGDSLSFSISVSNPYRKPLEYYLGLIRWGWLWYCDPSGNSLRYELSWETGADGRLRAGEREQAQVQVSLPYAAGNTCKGANGKLIFYVIGVR